MRRELAKPDGADGMIGDSAPMQRLKASVAALAPADTTVLMIVGETGTGKELVAQEIHRRSARCERVLVKVNVRTDVRVIAATNRDLAQMVSRGEFRSDLYYRLNVFPLTVPPLRDRGDDAARLVRHYLGACGRKLGKRLDDISPRSAQWLSTYAWPGNVRELANVVERGRSCQGADRRSDEHHRGVRGRIAAAGHGQRQPRRARGFRARAHRAAAPPLACTSSVGPSQDQALLHQACGAIDGVAALAQGVVARRVIGGGERDLRLDANAGRRVDVIAGV